MSLNTDLGCIEALEKTITYINSNKNEIKVNNNYKNVWKYVNLKHEIIWINSVFIRHI